MKLHQQTAALRPLLSVALALALAASATAMAKDPFEAGDLSLTTDKDGIQTLVTPPLKTDELIARHIAAHKPGRPLRIGEPFALQAGTNDVGTWSTQGDEAIWRLRIHSPNARSINLGLSHFHLPEGASLWLLDDQGEAAMRPFTAADNKDHGQLWTPLVVGEEMMLELRVPLALQDQVALSLGSINAGFVDLDDPWAAVKSGSCNVDVVCPEGDQWRDQIRSVGAYTISGVDYCSGTLVNNARGDGTPYFLTARHCLSNQSAASSTVVYWNYQNSTCRAPGSSQSGQPGDGQRTQFNSGTILRATGEASDFTLLEMEDPINPDYDLYWSGVDATGTAPSSAVAIHHPRVEEKRISFENDPLTVSKYLGDPGSGTTHWRVGSWDLGTTEGGSSGSALFSPYPEKRVVGQLHGGYASCTDSRGDWYGRVSVSWTGGGTPATQLKSWLDPDNTGVLTIDGRGAAPFSLAVSPSAVGICRAEDSTALDIQVGQAEAGFTDPVALSFSGLPTGANGSLSSSTVIPPGSSTLSITDLATAAAGSHVIQIEAVSGTDALSQAIPFELSAGVPAASVPLAPANDSVGHSTSPLLSWSADTDAFEYRLEVATDAAFANLVSDQIVAGNSAPLTGLASNTWYYWRVTAGNFCGEANVSSVFRFKTAPAPGDCDDSTVQVELFGEDFSAGLNGFSTSGSSGAQTWAISSARPSPISGGGAVRATNIASISDQRLTSPSLALPLDQNPITLRFQNWRDLEGPSGNDARCWDGGVLEISANGGPFSQIPDSIILNDPYRGPISGDYNNPLAGLPAWCNPSSSPRAWADTLVDLSNWAGQSVQLRWRLGTDSSIGREGWYVDDVRVHACETADTPLLPEIFADGFETNP